MIVKIIGASPLELAPLYHKDEDEFIFACDGGILICDEIGIKIDAALSDGDSSNLEETLLKHPDIKIYNPIKDKGDLDLALDALDDNEFLDKKDISIVKVYNALGGRMDHTIAALIDLKLHRNLPIHLLDQDNDIFLIKGPIKQKIETKDYKYFSLYSFEDSVISIHHAHYNLDHYLLKSTDNLCLSNQMIDHYSEIETDKDLICVFSK